VLNLNLYGLSCYQTWGIIGMMPWFYYVARALVKILVTLFTRLRVIGKENIPGEGPLLIVANHLNLADPPILGIIFGRKVVFMAKEELFRSWFCGYFMRGFGAFPVHRRRLDRNALHEATRVLKQGKGLVVFPEGSRSRSKRLQPGLPGAAVVALRSRVPLLPVGISGTEKIKGVAWIFRRPEITVNIGRPFQITSVNGRPTKEELIRLTDGIMGHIAGLLPPKYVGRYKRQGVK